MEAAIAPTGVPVERGEGARADVSVTIDDTVVETNIAAWMERLMRRPRRRAMAETASHELIIVRRHEEEEHAQHSSAWKVAHADFMTAMMAFFLIMWLINVTDDNVRKGIAQYFNPIHMSQGSSELKGLSTVKSADASAKKGHGQMPVPGANINPIELSAGHAETKSMSPEAAAAALNAAAELAAKLTAGSAIGDTQNKDEERRVRPADALKKLNAAAAALKPPNGGYDREAFQDPYAVLAKLEKEYVSTQATSVDVITGDARAEGMPGGEIERDPFDPSYWQMVPLPAAKASVAGKPGTAQQAPDSGKPDAAALSPSAAEPADTAAKPAASALEAVPPAKPAAPPDGPRRPWRRRRQRNRPPPQPKQRRTKPRRSPAAATEIAKDIKNSVAAMMAGKASPGLAVAATDEGVTINLTDDADYAMFPVGSAVPDPKTVVLLEHIAKVLAKQPGQIIVRGHTDGRPFHSADYDNWRLSTARAQMAYYTLLRGGLDQSRVIAIEGHADRALKNPDDPYAAENRRIEILVKGTQ